MDSVKQKLLTNITASYFPHTGVSAELVNLRNIHAHYHKDTLEFVYVIKGSAFGIVAHESTYMKAGDFCTIDQPDIRYLSADEDNITLIVHLDMNRAHIPIEILRNTLFSCTNLYFDEKKAPYYEEICDKMLALLYAKTLHDMKSDDEKYTDDAQFTEICEEIRLNIIDVLEKRFSWFSVDNMTDEDIRYRDRLRQIISYVAENFRTKITLTRMSKVLYLNPVYVSNFLKRTSFRSFTELVNYYRCLEAQKLILETSLPMGDISEMCGFSSEKYFYKSFKFYHDITPLQYKKRFKSYADRKEEYSLYRPEEALDILQNLIAERYIDRARRSE